MSTESTSSEADITKLSTESQSSASGSPSEPKMGRSRASTGDDVRCLEPENQPEEYDKERVEKALDFAEKRLCSRKISPSTKECLKFYQSSCKEWLNEHSRSTTQDNITDPLSKTQNKAPHPHNVHERSTTIQISRRIQMIEQEFQKLAYLRREIPADYVDVKDAALHARKQAYYAQFGDYFGERCAELRDGIRARNLTLEFPTLMKSWVDYAAKLEEESPAWEKHMSCFFQNPDDIVEHLKLRKVCDIMEIDLPQTVAAIQGYARRNKACHSQWQRLLKAGDFRSLAKMLHAELIDVPKVVTDPGEKTYLLCHIGGMIEEFWYVEDWTDPDKWENKQELYDRHSEIRHNEEKFHESFPSKIRKRTISMVEEAVEPTNDEEAALFQQASEGSAYEPEAGKTLSKHKGAKIPKFDHLANMSYEEKTKSLLKDLHATHHGVWVENATLTETKRLGKKLEAKRDKHAKKLAKSERKLREYCIRARSSFVKLLHRQTALNYLTEEFPKHRPPPPPEDA